MRKIVIAGILVCCTAPTFAEVTAADQALTRCWVDFKAARVLWLGRKQGETEEQALSQLEPGRAEIVQALQNFANNAAQVMIARQLTSEEVDLIEQVRDDEERELIKVVERTQDGHAYGDVYADLLARMKACQIEFPDL